MLLYILIFIANQIPKYLICSVWESCVEASEVDRISESDFKNEKVINQLFSTIINFVENLLIAVHDVDMYRFCHTFVILFNVCICFVNIAILKDL